MELKIKHTLTIKESIQLKHEKYIHVFNFYVFIMLGFLFCFSAVVNSFIRHEKMLKCNRLRVSELQCKVLFET